MSNFLPLTQNTRINRRVLFCLFALFFAGLASSFGVYKTLSADNGNNASPIYAVGEQVRRSGFDITINSSRTEQIEESYSSAPLNYKILDLSITNTGDKAVAFIPIFQAYIRTASGATYSMSPLPGIQPIFAGDIEPNTTISGELSYFIPEDGQELMFFFDPGWGLQKAVLVEL